MDAVELVKEVALNAASGGIAVAGWQSPQRGGQQIGSSAYPARGMDRTDRISVYGV